MTKKAANFNAISVFCMFIVSSCCCLAVVLLSFCGVLCVIEENQDGNKPLGLLCFHPR